jgi:hypothetical protein
MIRECFRTKTGIIFDKHMLENDIGLDVENILDPHCRVPPRSKPDSIYLQSYGQTPTFVYRLFKLFKVLTFVLWSHLVNHDPKLNEGESERTVSEGESAEEMKDALSPIYDRMSHSLFWQIMECIPFIFRKPSPDVYGTKSNWAYRWM